MATTFSYFGYQYEIIDEEKKEVALIDATNAPERCVVPKKVEYCDSVYTVVEIKNNTFRPYSYEYEYKGHYGSNSIVKAVVLYPTIRRIGEEAFYCCRALKEINIPDSVTSIGKSAFSDCTSLTSVTIPASVTSIGRSAFSGCTSLTSVTIPDSVASIEYEEFYDCTSLTSVTIPDSVTEIKAYAFSGCTSLTSVTIPTSVEKIDSKAFTKIENLKVEICNEEGDVLIHPEAFHPTAEIKYVGKKVKVAAKPKPEVKPETKAEPEPKPEPKEGAPATNGNGLVLQKGTVVADLKAAFSARFGAKLRIYSGRSQADVSATLGELGLTNEGDFECRASLTVGSFIERIQKEHGLKVKVYTCDEWVAVLDGLTLESAGKVKKNAVKADMESMIAYQRTDEEVEPVAVEAIKKSATYGDYTINIAPNNSVTVLKGGVACDNAKGALREVAALVGFEVDAAWTTQQLGSKLVDAINSGEYVAEPKEESSSIKSFFKKLFN